MLVKKIGEKKLWLRWSQLFPRFKGYFVQIIGYVYSQQLDLSANLYIPFKYFEYFKLSVS